ncbi:MAG TPA: hypothetical protein VD973_04865 [Symbiobacteriaceae bacterium]|jgi:hypothetical protein|nr:hypothetical protein [Symbiobacteriaceae bacterium]
MDHQGGKDPTPQGRTPDVVRRRQHPAPTEYEEEKYVNSAPGPAEQADGAYFYGYKRENAVQPERTEG